ncbi:MAG: hypothetical protein GF346_06405 [Candidatus Eisenbacteria bacterium]|nr:hypothetical protein [Candidatus Latescibacterota bacterium]MBD3302058.1 hypothetical protein [Candidatus Eisenbacteria bacterium]
MSDFPNSRTFEDRTRRAFGLLARSAPPLLAATLLVLGVQLADRHVARLPAEGTVRPADVEANTAVSHLPEGTAEPSSTAESSHRFVRVTVTGYTSVPEQTDDTPFLTATLSPTRPGTLALSRDLLRTFTRGAPFDFGDRVLIPGMGIYVVEDTMHPRWAHRADIWFRDNETARRWGRRQVYLARVDAEEPVLVASQWHPDPDL